MQPKTPSFTAYDILGYTVPGLALLAAVDLSVVYHFDRLHFNYPDVCVRYNSVNWTSLVPLFLVAYFLGHLVSFLSAVTVENFAKWLHGHPSRFLLDDQRPHYFQTSSKCRRVSWFLRGVAFVILWPVSLIHAFFTFVLPLAKNYNGTLDATLKEAVNMAFEDLYLRLGLTFPGDKKYEEDMYRLAFHDMIESAEAHVVGLRNYVVLYGFLRAMTLLLIAATWFAVGHILNFQLGWGLLWRATFIGSGLSFVSYSAYLKFWMRYHQEALMGFVAAYARSEHRVPEREKSALWSPRKDELPPFQETARNTVSTNTSVPPKIL